MMRSNAASPDVGMSAGMRKRGGSLAATSGAITRLNKKPVTLVKRKSENIANGANFSERKWGNLRGNFIQQDLHGYGDDHKGIRSSTCTDSQGNCTNQSRLPTAML